MRWERTQKRATITRERAAAPTAGDPFVRVDDPAELSYREVTNVIVPRVAAGLYQDVELHLELPYYLGQEVSWKYASGITLGAESAITNNAIDPNGDACGGTASPARSSQPAWATPPSTTAACSAT